MAEADPEDARLRSLELIARNGESWELPTFEDP